MGDRLISVPNARVLPLTQGKQTLVDADVYESIKGRPWCAAWAGNAWYVKGRDDGRQVFLHRFIVGAKRGQHVHHRNGDTLDNRRENLQVRGHSEHVREHKLNRATAAASGYRWVYWKKRKQRWCVQISTGGFTYNCAWEFTSAESAAALANRIARVIYGPGAYQNRLPGQATLSNDSTEP